MFLFFKYLPVPENEKLGTKDIKTYDDETIVALESYETKLVCYYENKVPLI